jgi:hypothetical protein
MPGDQLGSELFFAHEFEDSDFKQALQCSGIHRFPGVSSSQSVA